MKRKQTDSGSRTEEENHRPEIKCREEITETLAELCEAYPHVYEGLKIRDIFDIAFQGSAAHKNRQSELYYSIKNIG